jgi:hypothetical protein
MLPISHGDPTLPFGPTLPFVIPSEAEGLSELSNGQLLIEKASRSL